MRTSPSPLRQRLAAVTVAAVAPLVASLLAVPTHATDDATPTDGVTIVQANIKSGMELWRVRADVATVLSEDPDFITYNEVPSRRDIELAPEGYSLWRTPGQYTGASPVVWNSSRWTAIAQGTRRVNNYHGIPPGRHTKLGLRYANWVTLQSPDGRVVSVVAVHLPPQVKGLPTDLIRKGVKRVGALVEELSPQGPVFVGGDFNVHYRSTKYPRDLLTAAGMVPSFDALGAWVPTGDHRGAAIDYVFTRQTEQLDVTSQLTHELYSDHKALVVRQQWLDAPTTPDPEPDPEVEVETVVNVPDGTTTERKAVLLRLLRAINRAQPGTVLKMTTSRLDFPRVARRLMVAEDRGVTVQFVARSGPKKRTEAERTLRQGLGLLDSYSSSGFARCGGTCWSRWYEQSGTRGQLIVVPPDDTAGHRIDVSRQFELAVVSDHTSASIYTDRGSVDDALVVFPRPGIAARVFDSTSYSAMRRLPAL